MAQDTSDGRQIFQRQPGTSIKNMLDLASSILKLFLVCFCTEPLIFIIF